jgi:DNA polymerase epsilon subunit 2
MGRPSAQSIAHRLKLHNLVARPDAIAALESVLRTDPEPDRTLTTLCRGLRDKTNLRTNLVDRDLVAELVAELSKNEQDIEEERILVLDAFRCKPGNLLGTAAQKTNYVRERFTAVQKRIQRNKEYSRINFTPIEAILAGGAHPAAFTHVLGALTRVDAGRFCLEDLSGRLPLDLSALSEGLVGLFSEGCVVIAIGQIVEQDEAGSASARFGMQAAQMMMPPPETREETETHFPGLARTRFGLPPVSKQDALVMRDLEAAAEDVFFVAMSDVMLDLPHVLASLRRVFEGFAEAPPALMLLLGSFTSRPFANRAGAGEDQCTPEEFGKLMDKLGGLLSEFPVLCAQTHFVLVPGPNDPCASGPFCFPKPRLPGLFADRMTDRLQGRAQAKVTFASNPCRVLFHLQEICVFREDLQRKMLHRCAVASQGDAAAQLVKTLVDQAHLLPLPAQASPVFFGAAQALSLHPLPSVILLADAQEQFQFGYTEGACDAINPGPFSADAAFVVYRPAQRVTEFSRVVWG